jgi:peptidoglycan/xylan/chitin deacetylase (PgdA/CDA1 family)
LVTFLASQPPSIAQIEMSLKEIEAAVGEPLPKAARFPYWWENRDDRLHSRAWLTAGWQVSKMDRFARRVTFSRIP